MNEASASDGKYERVLSDLMTTTRTPCGTAHHVLSRRGVATGHGIQEVLKRHFWGPTAMFAAGNEALGLEQRGFIDKDDVETDLFRGWHGREITTISPSHLICVKNIEQMVSFQ